LQQLEPHDRAIAETYPCLSVVYTCWDIDVVICLNP
jgi:hypothetical protein